MLLLSNVTIPLWTKGFFVNPQNQQIFGQSICIPTVWRSTFCLRNQVLLSPFIGIVLNSGRDWGLRPAEHFTGRIHESDDLEKAGVWPIAANPGRNRWCIICIIPRTIHFCLMLPMYMLTMIYLHDSLPLDLYLSGRLRYLEESTAGTDFFFWRLSDLKNRTWWNILSGQQYYKKAAQNFFSKLSFCANAYPFAVIWRVSYCFILRSQKYGLILWIISLCQIICRSGNTHDTRLCIQNVLSISLTCAAAICMRNTKLVQQL